MPRLGIHQDFLQDLVRLERPLQQKVVETIRKFEQTAHAGAHLEKLNHIRDDRFKSIRIDRKYRGIVLVPEQGDEHILLRVGNHDETYAWVQNRRVSVNNAIGHIEIRDTETIDATIERLKADPAPTVQRVFAHVRDADLVRLGVDEQMRTFARKLTDIGMLEALEGKLPRVQYDVLIGLASGMSPEAVWDEIVGSVALERFDPEDVAAAVRRMPDKVVLVEGPDELLDLFDKPFARWRVYLHPTQRETAYRSYSGSAQVIGGPGTGKTVVALHRARHLAAQGGKVLLTTFTATLTRSLAEALRLLESDDEILSRIDVLTVDQVARRIVEERLGRFTLLQTKDERIIWRKIIRRRDLDYSETFLMEEWRQVILAQEVTSLDAYLAVRRVGRGRRLGPLQRAQAWRAVAEFEQELAELNARVYETVCIAAARLLVDESGKPYDHVIVDEAQDLHPVRWRVLRTAVLSGPNDIFLAGDAHQRIYDNRVSLSSIGIYVAGRTAQLKVNYRTTAEILSWSLDMLSGEQVVGLDDDEISLVGLRSEVHGSRPHVFGATAKHAELEHLTMMVRGWLDAGVRPEEIGITGRSGMHLQDAVATLTRSGIAACLLSREKDALDGSVQVMTMHRAKGLEFRCVAVIGVGADQVPSVTNVRSIEEDEPTHRNDLQRERCLLFVACTRARERLSVSWYGERSPFLR
ncbi:UvrD-helicase domain-containing protein [Streptosporangium sp. V21-05]|uniref:UvrD-helicase domain-containing protein n=1 Tax=Streptosporangium sp. V21-05 TaxID=3446115 RepID=UPI003F5374DA